MGNKNDRSIENGISTSITCWPIDYEQTPRFPANLKLVNGIQKSKDRSTEEFF